MAEVYYPFVYVSRYDLFKGKVFLAHTLSGLDSIPLRQEAKNENALKLRDRLSETLSYRDNRAKIDYIIDEFFEEAKLTPREANIISFSNGLLDGSIHPVKETSRKYCLTQKSARTIENKAYKKLHNPRTRRRIIRMIKK